MRSFIEWIHGLALGLGGVGLFVVAFLDSSFLSLPQINDLLVVLMVAAHEARMPYYVAMATAGSVAGCLVIHGLAAKGGDVLLSRRYGQGRLDKALGVYRRYGVLAIVVPALLPPPAPFKLFVLAAGIARVRRVPFALALTVSRGARYVVIGILSVYYGDAALDLVRTHGGSVALAVVAIIVGAALAWWLIRKRTTRAGQVRAG